MSTPANLTIDQITTRVMNEFRIPTTNTTEQTKVVNLINLVYRDIYAKQDWWFLRKRTALNTVAKITTGTVNVALGSTAVTFSSAPGLVQNYAFVIPGASKDSGAVYIMASTGTGAAQTLDAAFTNSTSTAQSYRLYQDRIPLPADVGKVLKVKRFGELWPIRAIGPDEMANIKTVDTTEGKPELWTVNDYVTTGDPTTQRMLILHPYPDQAYRLEVFYKQQLNTDLALAQTPNTQPLLPDEVRQILIYGTLARGYPMFINDLERAKFYQSLFNDMLALLTASQKEYARDDPRLIVDDLWRVKRRRDAAGFTLGTWFDRLPSEL